MNLQEDYRELTEIYKSIREDASWETYYEHNLKYYVKVTYWYIIASIGLIFVTPIIIFNRIFRKEHE